MTTSPSATNAPRQILVAEDDPAAAMLLESILRKGGYHGVMVRDGAEALRAMDRLPFQAVVTDWMMPRLDGLGLTVEIRRRYTTQPLVLMVTVLDSWEDQTRAVTSGADDFLSKPYVPMALLKALQMGLLKKGQPFPQVTLPCLRQAAAAPPPFLAVVLAASTGGPETVEDVILNLPPAATEDVCFFLALHGPAWMLSTYATHLRARTGWDVRLAEDGEAFQPGRLYIAPGDRHLEVAGPTPRARLTQDPPENFVRPSADPLLRTVARVFGPHAIVAVLTGVGCDGTMGAAHIAAACGTILVQSPETSVVAQMPAAVLRAGLSRQKVARHQMGAALGRVIQERRSAWRASVSPSS